MGAAVGMLPVKDKRLVCLASLSAYVKGSTMFDASIAAKLNKLMVLCSDDKAMRLPVQLSVAIWFNVDGERLIPLEVLNTDIVRQHDPSKMDQAVTAVIQAMPKWMRYADDEEIAEDVEKLLDVSPVVLGLS